MWPHDTEQTTLRPLTGFQPQLLTCTLDYLGYVAISSAPLRKIISLKPLEQWFPTGDTRTTSGRGGIQGRTGEDPVSYTHLDVYKRQPQILM